MIKSIKGECVGIRFRKRGKEDNHICIDLIIEDDGEWFPQEEDRSSNFSVSSAWLDELISVSQEAKRTLENQAKSEQDGFGYQYK